jgi:hypothetical protein
MCEGVCIMLEYFGSHKVETLPTKIELVRKVNATKTQTSVVCLKIALKL